MFFPMQDAVAVRAKRYALGLGFLDRGGDVVPDCRQFIDGLLVLANDMVEVDDRRVTESAVGALLARLVGFPFLPLDPAEFLVLGYLDLAVLEVPSPGVGLLSNFGEVFVL
jgi:hypothetical protein